MKNLKKKNLKNSAILSTISFGSNFKEIDPSNYNFLYGSRQSFFYLINPSTLNNDLKTGFKLLKSFLKSNFKLVFIGKIDNTTILNRFQKVCEKKNHIFLEDLDVETGFLTNHKVYETIIVTLFLEYEKAELVRKEATRLKIPILSFSDLSFNKMSNLISIVANYNSFISQNLILSSISLLLFTIC